MSIGHTVDGMGQDWQAFKAWASSADDATLSSILKKTGTSLGNMKVGDARRFILGADRATQVGLQKAMAGAFKSIPGVGTRTAQRMAGSALAKGAARVVPGLSVAGNVMDVADIVTGDESFANKAMDTVAMGIGGALGAAGGPLGISIGASTGKMVSDGAQWLFGDKKTPEQRRMEEALRDLQARGLI